MSKPKPKPERKPLNFVPATEILDLGILQELNRQILHPLGLALMLETDKSGATTIVGFADYRGEPDGVIFDEVDPKKAKTVELMLQSRAKVRQERLGWVIQPVPGRSKAS